MHTIAAFLVSLAALQPSAAPPTPPAAAPTAVQVPPTSKAFKPPPARIEVIELGVEPRRALRPSWSVGQTEEIELVVEPLINRFVDGDLVLNEKPVPMRFDLGLGVRELLPDGGVRIEATVRDTAASFAPAQEPGQAATITSALDGLRGGIVEIDLDRRGAVTEVRVPATLWPDDARGVIVERMLWGITRLFVPTPDDTLGVGGRWRVLFDDNLAPMARRELLVLRVLRLDDTTVDCERYAIWSELRRAQRVPEGTVPNAPDAILSHLSGRGGGTMTMRRDRLATTALEDQTFVKLFADGRDPSDKSLRQLHEQTMTKTTAKAKSKEK